MCCDQTPGASGQLCSEWTLASKMTANEHIQQGCPADGPALTSLAGTTKLWLLGSISCLLWIASLQGASSVFADRRLKIRRERIPGVPLSQVP